MMLSRNFSGCPSRKRIAEQFIRGSGIEIGPLHSAWPIPENVRVRYVDRYTRAELLKQYPDLNPNEVGETDIIDDGRTLASIRADSQDFVLHSHVLEHSDNPIATLEHWLRVLKVGGVCVGAVPNKEFTFDEHRPLTEFKELEAAYKGDLQFKKFALRSFYKYVSRLDGDALEQAVERSMNADDHVHFPVWNMQTLQNFLVMAPSCFSSKYTLELYQGNGMEVLFVLRKSV